MATSKLQALWNHPAVHFWAPTFKWGISIANFADFSKPPEKVSYPQQVANQVFWSKELKKVLLKYNGFKLKVVNQIVKSIFNKNWNLFRVNVVMSGTGIYQLARKIWHNYFNEEQAVVAKE